MSWVNKMGRIEPQNGNSLPLNKSNKSNDKIAMTAFHSGLLCIINYASGPKDSSTTNINFWWNWKGIKGGRVGGMLDPLAALKCVTKLTSMVMMLFCEMKTSPLYKKFRSIVCLFAERGLYIWGDIWEAKWTVLGCIYVDLINDAMPLCQAILGEEALWPMAISKKNLISQKWSTVL